MYIGIRRLLLHINGVAFVLQSGRLHHNGHPGCVGQRPQLLPCRPAGPGSSHRTHTHKRTYWYTCAAHTLMPHVFSCTARLCRIAPLTARAGSPLAQRNVSDLQQVVFGGGGRVVVRTRPCSPVLPLYVPWHMLFCDAWRTCIYMFTCTRGHWWCRNEGGRGRRRWQGPGPYSTYYIYLYLFIDARSAAGTRHARGAWTAANQMQVRLVRERILS